MSSASTKSTSFVQGAERTRPTPRPLSVAIRDRGPSRRCGTRNGFLAESPAAWPWAWPSALSSTTPFGLAGFRPAASAPTIGQAGLSIPTKLPNFPAIRRPGGAPPASFSLLPDDRRAGAQLALAIIASIDAPALRQDPGPARRAQGRRRSALLIAPGAQPTCWAAGAGGINGRPETSGPSPRQTGPSADASPLSALVKRGQCSWSRWWLLFPALSFLPLRGDIVGDPGHRRAALRPVEPAPGPAAGVGLTEPIAGRCCSTCWWLLLVAVSLGGDRYRGSRCSSAWRSPPCFSWWRMSRSIIRRPVPAAPGVRSRKFRAAARDMGRARAQRPRPILVMEFARRALFFRLGGRKSRRRKIAAQNRAGTRATSSWNLRRVSEIDSTGSEVLQEIKRRSRHRANKHLPPVLPAGVAACRAAGRFQRGDRG